MSKVPYIYELYTDKSNEWRWRLLSENGNNIGNSGEGYKNFQDCFELVKKIKGNADIRIVNEDKQTQLLVEKNLK